MSSMRWVGLDVHARETTGVVLDLASGVVETRRVAGRADRVLGWLETLELPFVAVAIAVARELATFAWEIATLP